MLFMQESTHLYVLVFLFHGLNVAEERELDLSDVVDFHSGDAEGGAGGQGTDAEMLET